MEEKNRKEKRQKTQTDTNTDTHTDTDTNLFRITISLMFASFSYLKNQLDRQDQLNCNSKQKKIEIQKKVENKTKHY